MSRTLHRRLARVASFALAFVVAGTTARAQFPITRVSVDGAGNEGNDASGYAFGHCGGVSSDGRFIAFTSKAWNLVAGDTNGCDDVFVRDRVAGTTVRVSVDSSGVQGNGASLVPSISSDGRFVTFMSRADNLVANDANHVDDVFRHDRDPDGNGIFDEGNGVTERVSIDSAGVEGDFASSDSSLSADGALVVFSSLATNLVSGDSNQRMDVFLRDCIAGTTARITKGSNGDSFMPSISGDGKFIAFTSWASSLVAGDTNNYMDVFVYDRTAKTMTRVSVDSAGNQAWGQGPSPLSDDGSIVAFTSDASNLVAGDTNGTSDVFVHDLASGATTRESVGPGGAQFDDFSLAPSLSADGNVVTFMRYVLKMGDEGLYMADFRPFARDRAADVTLALNVNCGGRPANSDAMFPSVSADGTIVAFMGFADDLVADDTNGTGDVFVYDRTIVEPDATWSNYGAGFPGTLGIPTLGLSADPVLGTTRKLDVGNSSGTFAVGFLLVGSNSASLGTTRGGTILVDYLLIEPIALWPGGLSLATALPLDPAWCGASAYVQAIELDAGAQYGLSFTPGLQATLGK